MNTSHPKKLLCLSLLCLFTGWAALSGCQAFNYLAHKLAPAGKGKWIPPETEALSEGTRVLVLVYVDQAIQYQNNQLARYYTAAAVANELQSKLKVDVVDPATVEYFQASNINWTDSHPSQIGQRFHADFVLYIELQEFTTTAEQSGELLQGRITGNCGLYNVGKSSSDTIRMLWRNQVQSVYPPSMPAVAEIGTLDRIRQATFKLFSEKLVKHFYGHYEPY